MLPTHRAAPSTLRVLFLLAVLAAPLGAAEVNVTLGVTPDSIAGTDAQGRVRMFAPDPLQGGSSVSHFDSVAFPNLLMEPAINSDLAFVRPDLTIFQFRDIGWPAGSSTLTLRIMDSPGEGFNDPDLGPRRLAALEAAAAAWASRLGSQVEINIGVEFTDLTCGSQGGTLAQAGSDFLFEGFEGAPFSGTWYHGALAEALSGRNLSTEEDGFPPDTPEMTLQFNSAIDEACLGSGTGFYYGLDANVPAGQISFANVALHELAHGLGFSPFTNPASGNLFMGLPDIYIRFLFDNTLGMTWNRMTRAERVSSATNTGQLVWSGNRVTAQAPNFLLPAPALIVRSPASIAGNYSVGLAQFGPPLSDRGAGNVTGNLVVAEDGSMEPTLLCGPAVNGGELAGKIALIDRGTCTFVEKVAQAQNAGAIGAVIVNNVAGAPPGMAGNDASIRIPSVSITQSDGDRIKDVLAGGPPGSDAGGLRFSASNFEVAEGAGTASITVRRTGGTAGAVSARVVTTDATATAGEDYVASRATVRFGDGQSGARAVTVEVLDDTVSEGAETVQLALADATGGATLANPSVAVLTIVDDDVNPAGFLAFGAASFATSEGNPSVEISVVRTAGTAGVVTVDVATGDGTATPSADYVPLLETVTFADGEGGSKSVQLEILDDDEEEALETIGLALSNPTGGALLGNPPAAVVEIADNEACRPAAERMCLGQGRFRVELDWRDFNGNTGAGQVVLTSIDSGLFWFFDPDNWEMLVKVLDGCAVNDRFWVFAAATTNVEYTLRVTDTVSGEMRRFFNPLGTAAPAITDTDAFATCP